MSAPTTAVEAAQPAAVADSTPAAVASQQESKQEENPTKVEEEVMQEDSADAQVKQEDAAAKAEEATDVKMENAQAEADGEVKKEESASKPGPLLKTKAPLKKDVSNKKYDPSALPITDDAQTIRTQFEFYFGDSNLPSDKHMWTITGGPENKPVKVKHICDFGRCKRFQPYEAVIAALKDSKFLELSGADGEEEVKRKKAYVPATENAQQRLASSVYVKGFGDETPTTQFEIEEFFARYGPVSAIRLRRTDEQYFKGSVFVEFPSEKAAQAFLALDPAPTYQDHALKIMSKKAYIEEKNQLIKEGKLEPQHQPRKKFWEGKDLTNNKGRGRGGPGGGRGRDDRNVDSNDWKKRRENDQRNGHGGRGGRGRGRGGRGRGGRGDRNGRDDRRRDEGAPASTNNVQKPRINSSAPGDEFKKENGKRARENDDGAAASEPPAKKVDTKAEGAAAPAERND